MIQGQFPPTLQRSIDQLTRNKHLIDIICITIGTASRTNGLKRRSEGWLGSCSAHAVQVSLPSEERASTSHNFPGLHAQLTPNTLRLLETLHSFEKSVNCIQLATAPDLDCSVTKSSFGNSDALTRDSTAAISHLCLGLTMYSSSNRFFHRSDLCRTDNFQKIPVQRNCSDA